MITVLQRMENQVLPSQLDGQNIDTKVGYRHDRRTGKLDKIQDMALEEEEEEEKDS